MKNIFKAIGGFFVKIYKAVISGGDPTIAQLPTDLQITPAEIDECIKAVNIIKGVVNSPATVLVTDLTPITMDNDIRLAISDALPGVLAGLTFAKGLITGVSDSNDQINALLANIRLSDDPEKDALYHNLAARLIMIASKGKVSWSDAVSILEIYFKQIFGISATPAPAAPVISTPAIPLVAPVIDLPAVAPAIPAVAPATDQTNSVELPQLTSEQIAAIVANAATQASPSA